METTLRPGPCFGGELSPSMGRFYRADARSAGERSRGFQVEGIVSRSNALSMGAGRDARGTLVRRKGAAPPWIASRQCQIVAPGNDVRYRAGILARTRSVASMGAERWELRKEKVLREACAHFSQWGVQGVPGTPCIVQSCPRASQPAHTHLVRSSPDSHHLKPKSPLSRAPRVRLVSSAQTRRPPPPFRGGPGAPAPKASAGNLRENP